MYRIIFDTNAILNNIENEDSHIYKIIENCIAGKIQAIISSRINNENENILEKHNNKSEFFDLLDELNKNSEIVEPQQPEDNAFVEAALEADADFLITDNSDLLDMDEYEGVRMITPEQMWEMYKDSCSEDSSWDMWEEN